MADREFLSKEPKRLKTRLTVFCGLLACSILPTRRARAETPVGLEAQGVSVSWALHNPLGLDVRDALARPVSARLIEEQIKSAQAGAEISAAYASRLAFARALSRFLDFLPALKLFLAGGFPHSARTSPGIERTSPKPNPEFALCLQAVFGLLACSAALLFQAVSRPTRPSEPSLIPLRC